MSPVTCAPYSPAATRANEPQPQPISSTWSPGPSSSVADPPQLAELRLVERLVAVLEDGARVGHRLVEEELEELVAEVVVVYQEIRVQKIVFESTPHLLVFILDETWYVDSR